MGKRETEYRKEAFGTKGTHKEGVLRQSLVLLSFVAKPDIARDAFRNRKKIYIYLYMIICFISLAWHGAARSDFLPPLWHLLQLGPYL